MALTHKEIWAMADELEAKGVEPTLLAVRKALGCGSYTTLSDAMAERRKQAFSHMPNAKEPLRPALAQQLDRLGQQVNVSDDGTVAAVGKINAQTAQSKLRHLRMFVEWLEAEELAWPHFPTVQDEDARPVQAGAREAWAE